MSDEADFSSEQEIVDNARALKEWQRQKHGGFIRLEYGVVWSTNPEESKNWMPVVDKGTVKVCFDCDEEILPQARADIPHVIRCLDCQQDFERRGKYE